MKWLASAAFVMALTACIGTIDRDWQPQIGRYSVEDVKRELGHPESCIGLDDGGTACSWTTAKGGNGIDKLVLTFGPDGKLATFNKIHF